MYVHSVSLSLWRVFFKNLLFMLGKYNLAYMVILYYEII